MPEKDEREIKRRKKLAQIRQEEEEDLTLRKAKKLGLPYVNLRLKHISQKALGTIPEERARTLGAIVFEYDADLISLAAVNPEHPEIKAFVDELSPYGKVTLYTASKSSMEYAFLGYAFLPKVQAPITAVLFIERTVEELRKKLLPMLQSFIDELSTLEGEDTTVVLEKICSAAVILEASDIHVEPEETYAHLRIRVDGVLHQMTKLSLETYKLLRDRVKLMTGMKLNIHVRAQDGRLTLKIGAKEIEVRASVTPSAFGESVVLRLLDPKLIVLELEELGLRKRDLEVFKDHIGRPNGMVLNTGPTGCGKTTTLYAFLKRKQTPEIKIITIEDPIEYHLEGITQTQVNPERGYDFPIALRASLRHDPDVVLVGEIRDPETAKTAINAALTGHLVLSTLHTNEAVGTMARLEELDAPRDLIPASVNLVMAQRLVRKLCSNCKTSYEPDIKTKETMLKALAIISPKANTEIPQDIEKLWRPNGCPECWGLGYKGQIGIFEYFEMKQRITAAILANATVEELRDIAVDEGMITLLQDGYLKALDGVTTIEEVMRVAGETAGYMEAMYERVVTGKMRRGVRATKEQMERVVAASASKDGTSKLILSTPRQDMLAITMAAGAANRAADVHFEAQEKTALIRLRIDGFLYDIGTFSLELYPTLIAEIKILAGLRTDIHDRVQEGRFSLMMPEETRDVRVSIIPGGYGETAVLRILMAEQKLITLDLLGLLPEILPVIERAIRNPNGMILVGGATGTGKTTTLYAIMQKLNAPTVKIISIEDPVEYRLEGIIQTQVDEERGYTFASALRSILRQNPNIMIIGEIRDQETAKLALQASLTGHLVFSTIHANDAVSVIPRLENLGIGPADIAAGIKTVIAQRLVRRLCKYCSRTKKADASEIKLINGAISGMPDKWRSVFRDIEKKTYAVGKPVGCAKCGLTGYFGQIGIFEILVPDESFNAALVTTKEYGRLASAAHDAGMISMLQDGVIKVLRGITTLEELERIL